MTNQLIAIQNSKIEKIENSLNSEGFLSLLRESHSVFTTFLRSISKTELLAHLSRLKNNAEAMNIPFPWNCEHLALWLLDWLERENTEDVLRLSVFGDSELVKSGQILISTRPVPKKTAEGLRLKSMAYEKPLPTVKSGRLSKAFSLREQVQSQGFDDALWFNASGQITEATTANIWGISQGGILYTPDPQKDGCLAGITREQILKEVKALDISVVIDSINLAQAKNMDALFISNAVIGLKKVASLDNVLFPWNGDSSALYQNIKDRLNQRP